LVIQNAHAFLVGKRLMLFIFFQHVENALAGLNLIRIPFRRIDTGAVSIFSFESSFGAGDCVQATRPDAITAMSNSFFIIDLRFAAGLRLPPRHQKIVNGAITMNFTSRSSWKMLP
jgi:hypothetical protein